MTYAAFQGEDAYVSKVAGASVDVQIINANDPADVIIGATTGINSTDNFETNPVEEAGNDGVDEHVQGRHDGGCTIPAVFTPEWNDNLPTRQDFLGREFIILETVSEEYPGAGNVLNAYTGCKINRVGQAQGARGNKTVDLGFVYQRRYNGAEWAALTGA